MKPLVLIRGAGDIASGIALRLYHAGMRIVMCEIEAPTAIRRTVAFSEAVRKGEMRVEDVTAKLCGDAAEALNTANNGTIALLIDPEAACKEALRPDVLVDAILAKKNTGTVITDAKVVIGVGPGFSAGRDCHACIETQRGHFLGRTLYEGSPSANTGTPGSIGGFTSERLLRAPADGIFHTDREIGDMAEAGEIIATVNDIPVTAQIPGVLRGLLADNTPVTKGFKCGDIDPRGDISYCDTVSDKALSVAGGVLEAVCKRLN
ncbi:MAG: EF2563 family selenium-dependent molybdenum hydroxylase system protein [Lachnospiraceae bacterium]|nr:EF2563 family selenium-dependent molybdenum hydroxylase system protein [Lachnospiraceae bacterium]